MRAVRFHGPVRGLALEDVPTPSPDGTEVLVRVAGAGVCHTDLHVVDGVQTRFEVPIILGHEVAGWVEAIGPAADVILRRANISVGDPVVVAGGWGCGTCRECEGGAEQRCASSRAPGFQVDGGYAEAMLVPHPRHLVPLGSLDAVDAAPLADAGVTPYRAVRRAEPWFGASARVLQIGCGGLGQFALQLLRTVPAMGEELRIGVRELDPRRVERATEFGADIAFLDGDATMARDALGGPADVVLDFVGADSTLQLAADVVAPGGLVLLVGERGGSLPFGFERVPVESWLTTVAWGSAEDLRAVVSLARAGKLRWDVERVPLASAADAHRRLRAGEVDGRLVLVP
jgi:alcohol dehydrogenase, propanol-preferring